MPAEDKAEVPRFLLGPMPLAMEEALKIAGILLSHGSVSLRERFPKVTWSTLDANAPAPQVIVVQKDAAGGFPDEPEMCEAKTGPLSICSSSAECTPWPRGGYILCGAAFLAAMDQVFRMSQDGRGETIIKSDAAFIAFLRTLPTTPLSETEPRPQVSSLWIQLLVFVLGHEMYHLSDADLAVERPPVAAHNRFDTSCRESEFFRGVWKLTKEDVEIDVPLAQTADPKLGLWNAELNADRYAAAQMVEGIEFIQSESAYRGPAVQFDALRALTLLGLTVWLRNATTFFDTYCPGVTTTRFMLSRCMCQQNRLPNRLDRSRAAAALFMDSHVNMLLRVRRAGIAVATVRSATSTREDLLDPKRKLTGDEFWLGILELMTRVPANLAKQACEALQGEELLAKLPSSPPEGSRVKTVMAFASLEGIFDPKGAGIEGRGTPTADELMEMCR